MSVRTIVREARTDKISSEYLRANLHLNICVAVVNLCSFNENNERHQLPRSLLRWALCSAQHRPDQWVVAHATFSHDMPLYQRT